MYETILRLAGERPAPYEQGEHKFWDDEHISKQMLQAHLAPDWDAASRRHAFIARSAAWLAARYAKPDARLLDLGCGPGLYAERFCMAGLRVTGVDLSPRSIAYARQSAARQGLAIDYREGDYLAVDLGEGYELAVMIYCDYGVLPPESRAALLRRTFAALAPGGWLALDGDAPGRLAGFREGKTYEIEAAGGFWSPKPYLCLRESALYPDTQNYLERYVVVTEDDCRAYNNWNQIFTAESLAAELKAAGFADIALYDDVAGAPYTGGAETLCAVARKPA